jgi:chromosome segregation ATPase
MYNTILEQQAFNAKEDIKSVIDDLLTEIHELEESHEKLEDTIDIYIEVIEGLNARIHELESKLDNSF